MRIGILGSGNIGGTLAKLWVNANHEVRFGSQDPARTRVKAEALDRRILVDIPSNVADWAEAILLAIPLHATTTLARSLVEGAQGKPLLDAGNAIPARDGASAEAATAIGGTGLWVASLVPGAHVVKAFNTVHFQTIAAEAHRAAPRVGVPLAGDDEAALAIAERLVRDAGLDPIRVGTLAEGSRIDVGSPVWNTNMTAAEISTTLKLA